MEIEFVNLKRLNVHGTINFYSFGSVVRIIEKRKSFNKWIIEIKYLRADN